MFTQYFEHKIFNTKIFQIIVKPFLFDHTSIHFAETHYKNHQIDLSLAKISQVTHKNLKNHFSKNLSTKIRFFVTDDATERFKSLKLQL